MRLNSRVHTTLLLLVFLATLAVLGKVVVGSEQGDTQAYQLPANPPLPNAKLQEAEILPEVESSYYSQLLAGRRYSYQLQDLPLTAAVYYVTGTAGDLSTFTQGYTALVARPTLQQTVQKNQSSGFYSLYQTDQQAFLTACIAPQGGSTVTRNQFVEGWNNHLYMLGREGYLDDRCLWTTLSIPLKNVSVQDAFQALEATWPAWYKWWKAKFPPLGTT